MTSPFGTRDSDTRRQKELTARRRALARSNRRRSIVTSAFGLIVVGGVIAGAVVAMMTFPSKPTTSVAGQSLTSSGDTQGMSSDMPGMDMGPGSSDVPEADPTPAATPDPGSGAMPGMTGDMNGMDMYPVPKDIPATKPTPAPDHGGGEMSGDMPGMDMPGSEHDHGSTPAVASDRPLAPVLGTFGGGTSAVMLTAGFLRRRDRSASTAKQAARAARKAQK